MNRTAVAGSPRREVILKSAVRVFGRHGFRKTTVDDLALAAEVSKQGLYLHFSSKEQIFLESMRQYLDDGLVLVDAALARHGAMLADRLVDALDAWFGRHLETFAPDSFDVIATGNHLWAPAIERYKSAFKERLSLALVAAPEFAKSGNACSAAEVAEVLFTFGLSWKEGRLGRAEFREKLALGVRAVCQLGREGAAH